jgi:hypothetical protein
MNSAMEPKKSRLSRFYWEVLIPFDAYLWEITAPFIKAFFIFFAVAIVMWLLGNMAVNGTKLLTAPQGTTRSCFTDEPAASMNTDWSLCASDARDPFFFCPPENRKD